MRIILDAMGSDNHPEPEILAAVKAMEVFDDEIILVGNETILEPFIKKIVPTGVPLRIVHAPDVLTMTDKPSRSARKKTENSMAVGMRMLKAGEAEAMVTAGNTGGVMANALFQLGRLRGVRRPANTLALPVRNGKCVLLDVGANADCKPEFLLQFAIMGAVYAEKILHIHNPRIGLLSNGEEEGKGNQLNKDTFPLLKESGLNFYGNVEGKEIFEGKVDVAVTDGFTGNVAIKISEAVVQFVFETIKTELTSSLLPSIGALLAKPAFNRVKSALNPDDIGGVPLLGVNGVIIIAHGRSNENALFSAIHAAQQAVEANLIDGLEEAIQEKLMNLPDTSL